MTRTKWAPGAVIGLLLLSGAALWPVLFRPVARPDDPAQRDVLFRYRLTISEIPRTARQVRVWAPMPFTDTRQTLMSHRVAGAWPREIMQDAEYGNRFLVFDFSQAARSGADSVSVEIEYHVIRRAYRVVSGEPAGTAKAAFHASPFLRPDRLIPFNEKIAAEAAAVSGHLEDPMKQARSLYDHIVETVRYDKTGQGWGRGDAVYACDIRAGNCTDFHSLFIGESRALGIPARFVMGVPLPPDRDRGSIPGYHCWAEFLVAPLGWIPIDASEAHKDRRRQDELFGGLDANRIGFTIGRDIQLPGAAAGPLNYVIYPHVEIDGRVHDAARAEFEFEESVLRELALAGGNP